MKLKLLFICLVFLLAGCQREGDGLIDADEDVILVLVDGRPVTLPMLEFLMRHRGVAEDDVEGMRGLLEELIRIRVMANAAESEGLAAAQRIRAERAVRDMETLYLRYLEKFQGDNPVTEADIEAAYQEQVQRSGQRQYRIETLAFDSQADALRILADIQDGVLSFEAAAEGEGVAVERPGWIDLSQVPPEFRVELQRIRDESLVPALLHWQDQWRVVRVAETRALEPPALEDVRPGIQRTLVRQRSQALIEELYEAAEITPMLPMDELE